MEMHLSFVFGVFYYSLTPLCLPRVLFPVPTYDQIVCAMFLALSVYVCCYCLVSEDLKAASVSTNVAVNLPTDNTVLYDCLLLLKVFK
jgi:hypothetical protein